MTEENEITAIQSNDCQDEVLFRRQQLWIGSIGFLMPILLIAIAGLRLTGAHRWAPLSSISAYFYTGATAAFSGMLFVLAFFFLTYPGFKNQYYVFDWILSKIACVAAFLVALFPTDAPQGYPTLTWWTPGTGKIHFISAAVLFSSFVLFSIFLFPIAGDKSGKPLKKGKKIRNAIYYLSGLLITTCIIWAVFNVRSTKPIFVPEAFALEFFAISFLVKGHIHQVPGRVRPYIRHPRRIVKKVQDDLHINQNQETAVVESMPGKSA